jgi:hypothetical protein
MLDIMKNTLNKIFFLNCNQNIFLLNNKSFLINVVQQLMYEQL